MSHKIHLWSAETPELQKELPEHPIGIAYYPGKKVSHPCTY
jgi:hypothetical protein